MGSMEGTMTDDQDNLEKDPERYAFKAVSDGFWIAAPLAGAVIVLTWLFG
jgi:hypothetical protein